MKKTLCLLICMAMLFTLLPTSAFATEVQELEGDVWDGTITQPTTLVQKDGVYYYEITKCSELAYVAEVGGDWLEYNYLLCNNLILNDVKIKWDENGICTNPENLMEWNSMSFYGNFDGQNFTVSGCYNCLFRHLLNGSVKNLNVVNSYSSFPGNDSCGGIISYMRGGCVENCSFDGCVQIDATKKRFIGGVVGYCEYSDKGNYISNCTNYGDVFSDISTRYGGYAGGVVGNPGTAVVSCRNYGCVIGQFAGGISGCGYGTDFTDCYNYGKVSGLIGTGGIFGGFDSLGSPNVSRCVNYGIITSQDSRAGGIAGSLGTCRYTTISECINYGQISGKECIGGIVGEQNYDRGEIENGIDKCANFGKVSGESCIGGIVGGNYTYCIPHYVKNCYNSGTIQGAEKVGGIIGYNYNSNILCCYSIGPVLGSSEFGGICGNSAHIWGNGTITGTYYLDSTASSGCGNLSEDVINAFEARNETNLRNTANYKDWDFSAIWIIAQNANGGYPYLKWQDSIESNISTTGIILDKSETTIFQGDCIYLTAMVSPATASNISIIWESTNNSVATVSQAGKVVAVAPGTATITATTVDGGYTATCAVTVTARQPMEYQINNIMVREDDGTPLQTIPKSNFLATVSVTKLTEAGNSMIFLASYTAAGQFKGLMYVSVEDLPIGATIKVTLPVDNSKNDIAELKAFVIPSFSNLQPIGNAVAFPAESQ